MIDLNFGHEEMRTRLLRISSVSTQLAQYAQGAIRAQERSPMPPALSGNDSIPPFLSKQTQRPATSATNTINTLANQLSVLSLQGPGTPK